MHFAKVVVFCVLVALAPVACFGQAKQPKLVELDSKAIGDPDLGMLAKELKRDENTSTIKVVRTKGTKVSSVGSSMFVVRAIYEIANARKCEYFINLDEWTDKDGSQLYVAGFTNKQDADLKKEFGDEYGYENEFGQKRKYLSVSQFSPLFKSNPQKNESGPEPAQK